MPIHNVLHSLHHSGRVETDELAASARTSPEPVPARECEPGATNLRTSDTPEPGITGSHWLNQSAEREIVFEDCAALTRAGEPCLARPRAGSPFCIFHDPAYRETQRENSAFGGRSSGQARRRREDAQAPLLFADASNRGYWLGSVLEGQVTGKMAPSRARAALAAIAALERLERGWG